MKKMLFAAAIAAMFVACNGNTQSTEETKAVCDSTACCQSDSAVCDSAAADSAVCDSAAVEAVEE